MALPWLEAMVPSAGRQASAATKGKMRLVCIEMVHGAAGCTDIGRAKNLWSPAATGRGFDLSPTSLRTLEPYRDYITIVSDTDVRHGEASTPAEVGADHVRSTSVTFTQTHLKHTRESDVRAGTSLDQIYAQKFGQETAIPSLQLCIDGSGAGCSSYGYSCVYQDTISWASPTEPLPMTRDPRQVFAQLFGQGSRSAERQQRRAEDQSILDAITATVTRLKSGLGVADRQRLDKYLTDVRELERRIQRVEQQNTTTVSAEFPDAPLGVPDSFSEHVELMFDLQALAFASDLTRVTAFKMARDASSRAYPESGVKGGFHPVSHHGDKENGIVELAQLNTYHVGMVPYFLEKLKSIPDGDASLLDNTAIIYASPMANSQVHSHRRCPLFIAGHAGGKLPGNLHLQAPLGTPMANVFLSVLQALGDEQATAFGDSTGAFDLASVPRSTRA